MAKARHYYIWEGNDTITITRGYAPAPSNNDSSKSDFLIKHKGAFKKYFPVINVDNIYICEPKKLCVGHQVDNMGKVFPRILEGWTVQRILVDVMTQKPYTIDISQRLLRDIQHFKNQADLYRRLYLDERKKVLTIAGDDRLKQKIKETFKTVADAKNVIVGGGDFNYSPYFSRYGLNTSSQQNTNTND